MLLEKDFTISATGKLFAKDLFNNIMFPENKLYEDNACTYKLILKSKNIVHVRAQLYYYYIRPNSITNSQFNMKKTDYIILTDQACNIISSIYPSLHAACLNRKATARLSILRQALSSTIGAQEEFLIKQLISYFKTNSRRILFSNEVRTRLKISTILILLNPYLLKLAGEIYEKTK